MSSACIVHVIIQKSVNVAMQVRIVRIVPSRRIEVVIVMRLEQTTSADADTHGCNMALLAEFVHATRGGMSGVGKRVKLLATAKVLVTARGRRVAVVVRRGCGKRRVNR